MFVFDQDDHRYYRSRIATAEEQGMFWVDEKTMYAASRHDTLSESYRSAAVRLHLAFLLLFRHFSYTVFRALAVTDSVTSLHLEEQSSVKSILKSVSSVMCMCSCILMCVQQTFVVTELCSSSV